MAQVIDPQVGRILDRSCQDCHSSHTTWPWYSHVAPVSWIVAKHVSEGREMLNFSAWADKPHSADERMVICDAVSDHRMPLPSYTLIHRNAKLSKRDGKLICDWAAAGGELTEIRGVDEGIGLFDPENKTQVKLARRLAGPAPAATVPSANCSKAEL